MAISYEVPHQEPDDDERSRRIDFFAASTLTGVMARSGRDVSPVHRATGRQVVAEFCFKMAMSMEAARKDAHRYVRDSPAMAPAAAGTVANDQTGQTTHGTKQTPVAATTTTHTTESEKV